VRADRGAAAAPGALDIAIVGISGRYPGARDLGALWTVLAGGKDCISEVPEDRWDWRHYQSGAAAHASKWGGFIAGFDEFDAAFFGLSAADARAIDPQERLVLEHAWAAVEDAGYTRASLVGPGRPGGVYAAVMYSDYQLFGATEEPGGERPLVTSLASIANRVSHLLDLRGPSMTIETMCSSSLTAVHLACQDLRRGHTALAIAGGVNLSVHPSKYAMLSAGRLISRSARSESFGEGGAGYVPGEGVGVVVLKRLEDAERDRDHVHAVIVGSAINHGGRAHGYFAPSPNAQREVVEQALADARLGPHEISYLEGHGTGTQLGDAVELAALTQVFGAAGPREPRCAIGSIKSNIGHAEAAAGMAALAKVVVQLRHRQLVPSLHAERANPNIDLATTPFRLSDVLAPWQPPVVAGRPGTPGRRIAGISAFGAGGSNAHLIVAEHRAAPPAIAQPADPVVVPLSASTPAQLQIRARQLLEVLEADEPIALADLAYTLQVGREAMAWRAGFVARTRDELIAQLAGFISGASDGGWFTGRAAPDRGLAALADDDELGAAIAGWIARRKLARLAELWTQGLEIDWRRLYPGEPPRRTPLPTYPFARDRHHVRRAEPAEPTRDAAPAPRDSSIRPVAPAPSLAGATTLADKVERLVVGFLRNTARSAAVGPDTELAALALDSVAVVGFVALWRAVVGTTIPAVAIYQARTPRELAHHITSHPGISDAALDAAGARLARRGAPTGERFALSAMQESFIVGRRLPTAGQAISSTIYLELEVRAALAVETLEQAWNSLVRHHDALRARITEDYTQAIAPVVPVYRIAVDDLSALDGAAQLARLAAHRDRMIDPVFDLERGPCFEVRMSRLAGDHAIVHLAIDELVADGFSVHLLAGQLMRACAAPPVEPAPLGYSYREYVETLHALTAEPASRASVDHWKSKLGPRPAPAPRFAHDAIAGGPKVRCLAGTLPAALWQAIQDGARARRCYPSAVLLTVFADVLAEHRGQDALRLGVTKRNRMAVHADVMRLVGLFITTNPFVHHRAPGEEFDARLGRTQHQLEADAPHEHVDATAVSRALRADGAPEPIDLPVIFTSLVSPGFGELAPGGAWRIRDVLNTTPGVQLDHQTFEQDGALAVRWYVPAGIAARGEVPAIFEAYLAELARRAGEFARAAAPDGGAPFALTHPQIAYAFGRLAAADHAAGCALHLEYELDGLDLARLNRAWREIRAHHPMLRASVLASGQQRILDVTPDSPVELDAAATSRDDYERRCQAIRQTMLAHDFPLDSYPYAAIAACALEGGPARIFLHLDLLIADARSAMLIARQLLGRYHDARYPLPGAAGSFRDHVIARLARRTGEAAAADTAYWEPKLARLPSGPALATTARPASRERHQLVRTLDCLAGLEARARRLGVALDTVLLAAYGEALVAWNAGAPCTAVVVSWDREPVFAGVDELVGDFTRLSWVAFAADPAHPADADARIRDAHAQLAADLARRSVDGLEVLRTRKGLALPAVFTCMTPGPAPAHAISQTPGVVVDAIARIAGDSALAIHWDSIAADRATEGDMFDRYCATLERWAALEAIDPPVDPPIELPAHGILLHEMFERQVAAHGARPAVVFGDTWVSYDELERRTRRVAGWLRAHGAQPDDVVAVFMDRSIEMVVALMAILRAGAAYLPLDVAAPQARTQQIVTSSRTRWVLTHRAQRSRWTARGALDVVCIDADDELGEVSAAAPAEVTEHHLAYVIYTSGSTGAPKGCMIEHRSITNRIAWMQRQFPLRPGDCVLQKTPYSFDVSVWEFFWPLAVGATIVVARPGGHLDASYLLDLIDRARITVCHFVPSMLRIVLAEPDLERMSRMQRVFVSGEALDYDVMEQFLDRVGIPLDNLYGPTEAAVDVSHWPCRKNPARETAIGRAISAVQLHVLDDQLQEVACGELGELYIGGVAVGRGYLGDPGLTAKSFIASPFGLPGTLYRTGDLASRTPDGDLRYGGRRDGQVKLNGLRIELAEIEHHLRGHAAVEDAMVAMEGAAGKELLVAYVVPRDPGARPAREALRELLRERVPAYMIPHAFVSIAAIPLTAHGKRRRGGPPITGIQTTDQPAGRALVALLRELPR
jgi:amino acid adenylation domain-containing protein